MLFNVSFKYVILWACQYYAVMINRVTTIFTANPKIDEIVFTIKPFVQVTLIKTWTKLHRRIMQSVYVYFIDYVLAKKDFI